MKNFEKVKEVLIDTIDCEAEDVKLEASLKDDLDVDSLDAVEVNMALEEEFGIEIPDDELFAMKTVGDIVKYLDENLK